RDQHPAAREAAPAVDAANRAPDSGAARDQHPAAREAAPAPAVDTANRAPDSGAARDQHPAAREAAPAPGVVRDQHQAALETELAAMRLALEEERGHRNDAQQRAHDAD